MKEDKLKKWIREERDQFESETPREGLWNEIETKLHGEVSPRNNGRIAWLVAAAIAALVALVFIYRPATPIPGVVEEDAQLDGAQGQDAIPFLSAEIQEAQSFYAGKVEERMLQLSKYPVDADLKEEMDLLAEEFEMLQTEMGQGLDDSKVVEAMIDNYRLRLDLLEDLLKALDNKSGEKGKKLNEEHEV